MYLDCCLIRRKYKNVSLKNTQTCQVQKKTPENTKRFAMTLSCSNKIFFLFSVGIKTQNLFSLVFGRLLELYFTHSLRCSSYHYFTNLHNITCSEFENFCLFGLSWNDKKIYQDERKSLLERFTRI